MNNNYIQTIQTNTLSVKSEEENYVIFLINDKKYAINIKNVLEIISIPIIEIPEKMPYAVVGIYNYKGVMSKVIDLCPFLGFQTQPFTITDKLIIISSQNETYSIATQDIVCIDSIKNDCLQEVPYSSTSSVLKQIFKLDDETINIIDIDTLNKLIEGNKEKENLINYSELFPKDEKSISALKLRGVSNNIEEIHSFNFNLLPTNQYVLFTLGNNNYYLELKYVKEFSSASRIQFAKLPYTPKYIKGIANIKGEFIIVVNLLYLFNENNNNYKEPQNYKIIVVEGKNFNIALLVDEIKGIQNLNEINQISYNNEFSEFIYSEFTNENQLFSIIDIEKVLDDERLYINI